MDALPGAEPAKPPYEVVWPADVDENDPPLAHPKLPSNLSTIVRDLDDMQARVRNEGGDFVLSSFFWLVFDGMRLDPVRDRMLFDYLNTHYHPFRYRDMARFAAFQNRVLRKFADARDLYFVDVAGTMPPDPNLFFDPVHATYDGVRLHAWLVAQRLAPLLRQRIAQGRLPRAGRDLGIHHPAFLKPERTVRIDCKAETATAPGDSAVRPYATGLAIPP